MKKSIKYIAMLCVAAVSLAFVGCEDPHTANLEDYQTLVYFRDGGVQVLPLTRVEKQTVCRIAVCKSGRNLDAVTTAEVLAMEQNQLDIYNMQYYTDYVIAPEDCFKITANREMAFGSDDSYKVVEVTINTEKLFDAQEKLSSEGKTVVVGIQLYSDSALSRGLNYVIFTPELEYAYVSFIGKNIEQRFTSVMPAWNDMEVTLQLNIENEWDFDCRIGIPDDVDKIVEEYNERYGDAEQDIVYRLLPRDLYEYPESVEFKKGVRTVPFKLRVNRYFKDSSEFADGNEPAPFFILPLAIKNITNDGISISPTSNVKVLLLSHEMQFIGLEDVAISGSMASSPYTHSSDGGGIPALFDGNILTYWHSVYNSKLGDETYGYYIDIELPTPARFFQFAYCTRNDNGNAVPLFITIGGSVDGETWEIIREDLIGTVASTGTWERGLPLVGSSDSELYNYVRFGVTQSMGGAGGNLKGDTAGKCVALSELELQTGANKPTYRAVY